MHPRTHNPFLRTSLHALLACLCLVWIQTPASQCNFLVIISDDQRPDTIHALGNRDIRTPNLDRLAQRGISFTRATCSNPHCVPSRAEILTGASGFRNGVWSASLKLRQDVTFWADAMRSAGYHTWYSGKWMNDGSPKTRGYEETRGLFSSGGARGQPLTHPTDHKGAPVTGYNGWTFKTDAGEVELEKGVGLTPCTSRHIATAAVELIIRKPERPFFLHVNFTAPHDPLHFPAGYERNYDPDKLPVPKNFLPEHPFDHGNLKGRDEQLLPWPRTPEAVRRELAAYYAVIEDMDAQIGRMIKALDDTGQSDRTVVIFSSDHGLALGSHGLMGKQNLYEHSINVPLIISGRGIARGRRTAAQCYLRDLFPTACELAGIPIPESVQGKSLLPVLQERSATIHPEVYGHFDQVSRMVRDDRWKLIWYPQIDRLQLFDLARDPHELKDLSAEPRQKDRVARMRANMETWFRSQGDPVFIKPD